MQLLHLHREGDRAALHLAPGDRGVGHRDGRYPSSVAASLAEHHADARPGVAPASARSARRCAGRCRPARAGRPSAAGTRWTARRRRAGAGGCGWRRGRGWRRRRRRAPGRCGRRARPPSRCRRGRGWRRSTAGGRRSGARGSAPCARAVGVGRATRGSRGGARRPPGRTSGARTPSTGAVSSSSSKSVSAPVTQPGTTSTHAPCPRNRRRGPVERGVEVGLRHPEQRRLPGDVPLDRDLREHADQPTRTPVRTGWLGRGRGPGRRRSR